MSFSDLPKEKKQVLALGVMVAILGAAALIGLVARPLQRARTQASKELADLSNNLDSANRLLQNEPLLQAQLAELRTTLGRAVQEQIPHPGNPLSWVTQRLYQHAREVGVNIQSVAPSSNPTFGFGNVVNTERAFSAYGVHLITEGTYEKLLAFAETVENAYPYVCVSALTVTGQPASPEKHRISMDLQWPIWRDLATADRVRLATEESRDEP